MTSRQARRLKKDAAQIIQAGKQMQILEDLHAHLLEHLSGAGNITTIHCDTLLYELYHNTDFYYFWVTALFQHWLKRNEQIILEQKAPRFFRYMFVPTVDAVRGDWLRRQWPNVVALNLHMNLWYGVIVCVVFVNPRKYPPAKYAQRLNMSYIPIHRMCFGTFDFYTGSCPDLSIEEDSKSTDHARDVRDLIRHAPCQPIWLWYDEDNFSGKRLSKSRWDALRDLFVSLCPKPFVCPICSKRRDRDFALDHIWPIADGHPQTLMNLMGICGSCNRNKGDRYGRGNPFDCPAFVPAGYCSEELKSILKDRPPWLGKVARPSGVREIQRVAL